MTLPVREARAEDAAAVVALVNSVYRGASSRRGWTTEADLVEGPRIDEASFHEILARPRSVVLLAEDAGRLVGCVHLEHDTPETCFLGMLSVDAAAQRGGLGRALLAAAEGFARETFGASTMAMHVVSVRHELLAWYERRGYRRTGEVEPFVPNAKSRFLRGPLEFVRLEKPLLP